MVQYTKKALQQLLRENGKEVTGKTKADLILDAYDFGLIKREPQEPIVKKRPGRPKKYIKEEVKVSDPKYERLKTLRLNPRIVKATNIETGEVQVYKSTYEASKALKRCWKYLISKNGKTIAGKLIEIST